MPMFELLSARHLKRYGLRRGAYDGANRRRFVLFVANGNVEQRHEFDTKAERDAKAVEMLYGRGYRPRFNEPINDGKGTYRAWPRHRQIF